MINHKICFCGKIRLIIPKLSSYPFLSGALIKYIPSVVGVLGRGGGGEGTNYLTEQGYTHLTDISVL